MQVKIFLHANRDMLATKGIQLGLEGEALSMFTYACYEVAVDLDVAEDGQATIVAVDGRKLGHKITDNPKETP